MRIYDDTQCQKEYEAEVHFVSLSFYVILLFELFFLVLSIGRSHVYVLLSCYLIDQGNKS
jgi:hypothetical protein